MTDSLYATMATKVTADRSAPPGTEESRYVETIDNDVMGALPFLPASTPSTRPQHRLLNTSATGTEVVGVSRGPVPQG